MPKLTAAVVRPNRPLTQWERVCLDTMSRGDHVRIAGIGMLADRDTWTESHHRRWYDRYVCRHIDMLRECDDPPQLDAALVNASRAWDLAREFSNLRPDAIVALGITPSALAPLTTAARFGVWRYDFDEADALAAQYVRPTWHIEGAIEALLPNGKRQTLHAGRLPKLPSLSRTVSHVLEATAYWPERAFAELAITSRLPSCEHETVSAQKPPSPATVARRQFERHFIAVLEKLFLLDIWNVGRLPCSANEILSGPQPNKIDWLHPLPGMRYLTNPFPADPNTGTEVLVEDFSYWRNPKGHIASIDLTNGATPVIQPAISSPGHMAYPHIFRWDDRLLCTPEMLETGCNGVYERTPDGAWLYLTTILKGRKIVDPTIFRHNGLWWLFCTIEGPFSETQLFCFHADNPLEDWQPHPLNPVKCDIRAGRPAGAVIRVGNRLLRPAQDSARHYGSAVSLCEITNLTPTTFEETTLARIEPDPDGPYPHGLHTINRLNGGLVVDGLKRRLHPLAAVYKARAQHAAQRRARNFSEAAAQR